MQNRHQHRHHDRWPAADDSGKWPKRNGEAYWIGTSDSLPIKQGLGPDRRARVNAEGIRDKW